MQNKSKGALKSCKSAIALCEASGSDFGVIDELCGGLLRKIGIEKKEKEKEKGKEKEKEKGEDDMEAAIMGKILGRKFYASKLQDAILKEKEDLKKEKKEGGEKEENDIANDIANGIANGIENDIAQKQTLVVRSNSDSDSDSDNEEERSQR